MHDDAFKQTQKLTKTSKKLIWSSRKHVTNKNLFNLIKY